MAAGRATERKGNGRLGTGPTGTGTTGTVGTRALLARKRAKKKGWWSELAPSLFPMVLLLLGLGPGDWDAGPSELVGGGQGLRRPFPSTRGGGGQVAAQSFAE